MTATNRYRFTALHTYAGHADRRYRVTRTTDGKVLGIVARHSYSPGHATWEIKCEGPRNGYWYDTRAEAADSLDALSLMDEICACGLPVGEHDRPTRAAMRAFAASLKVQPDNAKVARNAAYGAAYKTALRTQPYDYDEAESHAFLHCLRSQDAETVLVRTTDNGVYKLTLKDLPFTNSIEIGESRNDWKLGYWSDLDPSGDKQADMLRLIAMYESKGYVRAYDWSN